jgi:putative colanic acid biosynthesis UDP-glucose lipid carrier transferase
MLFKRGRYSGLLRPISYTIDLIIICILAIGFFKEQDQYLSYIIFISISWIVLSVISNFYKVYRFTKVVKIVSLIAKQSVLFTILVFAFFGYAREIDRSTMDISKYVIYVFSLITVFKLAIYYMLKKYRVLLGGNYRTVIIIGLNQKTDQLRKFFLDSPEYGYQLFKTFDVKNKKAPSIEEAFKYVLKNEIDEIYCSISELSDLQIQTIIDFADNNLKILKFIPDNKEIYTKKLDFNYYGYLPIISLRKIPIENSFNKFVKRFFDIVLSLFVIIFVLSWLTPILAIIIKLESKGPIFFKQKRNGLDYKEFYCYKYRSMRPNPEAHLHQIRKGDPRVTNIGKFIRKTSIDELPQFINVLKGEMSVVGPRPHMVSHTHMYAEKIDKFMVRHFVKPGITGLAQVSGYRGEVEDDSFITNRVKYDIFYLENWSLLLDLKIIFLTLYDALRGDDKAY